MKYETYEEIFSAVYGRVIKIGILLISLITMMEIIYYIVYKKTLSFDKNKQYIISNIVIPTAIDLIAYAITLLIYKSKKISLNIKKESFLYLLLVISTNIVIVHGSFAATYCVFIFPIIIASVYGDYKLEKRVFIVSVLCQTFSLLISYLRKTTTESSFLYNIMFSYLLILISNDLSKVFISVEDMKRNLFINAKIKNRNLEEKLHHDGLTNLYNHTKLFEILEKVEKDASENVYIAILDIDFFKNVNDSYGHEFGNVVLKRLSDILLENSSKSVIPARYGGEEFVIVFMNSSKDEVFETLEHIRKTFESQKYREDVEGKITVSAGATKYEKGWKPSKFFEEADKKLYKSKDNGRNQVTI